MSERCPTCDGERGERGHRHTELGSNGKSWTTLWGARHEPRNRSRHLHAGHIVNTELCPDTFHRGAL